MQLISLTLLLTFLSSWTGVYATEFVVEKISVNDHRIYLITADTLLVAAVDEHSPEGPSSYDEVLDFKNEHKVVHQLIWTTKNGPPLVIDLLDLDFSPTDIRYYSIDKDGIIASANISDAFINTLVKLKTPTE